MEKGKARCVPQAHHWHEDLPERNAPTDSMPEIVHRDINNLDDTYLEISRASTLMRGGGILFGLAGCVFFITGAIFWAFLLIDKEVTGSAFLTALAGLTVGLSTLGWATILALRLDLSIAGDRPVRFNRARQKVYVYEQAYGINPFTQWPIAIKQLDWDTLSAEIHRQAGFTGKAYIQRFALWLVSCPPGTREVAERFELKGNWPTTQELYGTWAYCRQYMEEGTNDLALYPSRRQEVSLRRSFFEYMRFLDPSEEGHEVRQRMTPGDWAFNVPFIALTWWLFIPMGIAHYVAMRLAPRVRWPEDVDVESRSG